MHQRRRAPTTEEEENDDGRLQPLLHPPANNDNNVNILSTFVTRTLSSPKFRVGALLWIIGMGFMTLMPPLSNITPQMREEYESMAVVPLEDKLKYNDALADLSAAEEVLYSSQVWFWRFRPEVKTIVDKNLELVALKRGVVEEMDKERSRAQSAASAHVGLWSEYGMEEMKARFWASFEGGKVFAQRQSFWGMIQVLLSSRGDEYFLSVLLRWGVMALINFTLGLIGALFYFSYTLFSMIIFYQADPWSGMTFFVLSFLGGASIVATYLIGLYGLAVGGVYMGGRVLLNNAALEQRRRQRFLREQQRQQQ